jgi:UDP-GlcNAc:undecaprenyl-phosphate GlcNAc-1-phosphate transferase
MTPDRGHLHHRLIDMGFSQKQTVAILYTISAVLGLSAVIWTKEGIFRAVVLIISVLIVSFIAFKVFEYEQNNKNKSKESSNDNNDAK